MVNPLPSGWKIRPWYSITYPGVFDSGFMRFFWKRIFCARGWHLWDEHDNVEMHDLYCDACKFTLVIDDVRTKEASEA